MKSTLRFTFHVVLGMAGSVAVGAALCAIIPLAARGLVRHATTWRFFTDVPYSPFLWGTGFFIGLIVTRRPRQFCMLGMDSGLDLVDVGSVGFFSHLLHRSLVLGRLRSSSHVRPAIHVGFQQVQR
jgi:hypothetical protein